MLILYHIQWLDATLLRDGKGRCQLRLNAMHYFFDKIREELGRALGVEPGAFVFPPDSAMGDLSLPMFALAKETKANPAELARVKAQEASVFKLPYLSECRAMGPYVNFFLDVAQVAKGVIGDIRQKKSEYGRSEIGNGRRMMIEYSNGNTHKEYHVGHLRNICYADSLVRILAASGTRVIPVSYINDFGIHIAKTIWGLTKGSRADEFKKMIEEGQPKGFVLGACYASTYAELEGDEKKKAEVAEIMKAIESRQGADYALWQETRDWSIDYFDSIYQELGVKFEHIFYESEVIDEGRLIVEELMKKGILKRNQGAIIADLEQYGLGVLPIIRSDDTALYTVGDLALASRKFQQYQLDVSVYVVDMRQSLYFQQLFKILQLSGYQAEMIHLTYDFVTLKNGMMSSRSGNVITYAEIYRQAKERAAIETRQRHQDWNDKQVSDTAHQLAISAIRFEMGKVSPDKVIVFDIDEALRFDGYTCAYLQYTGARISSLVRKNSDLMSRLGLGINFGRLQGDKEKAILLKLSQFPEVIAKAAVAYDPSPLARYLFELCQAFNDYYHETNIGKAEPALRRARIALAEAVAQTLGNGFKLLGIRYLNQM